MVIYVGGRDGGGRNAAIRTDRTKLCVLALAHPSIQFVQAGANDDQAWARLATSLFSSSSFEFDSFSFCSLSLSSIDPFHSG